MLQHTTVAAGDPITIDRVRKTFRTRDGGSIRALAETSVTIEPGQFVSVLGPSGCGKSTLMRLIAGLDSPTAGTVSVGAAEVTRPLEKVGVVFQQSTLMPWYSVEQNILLPARIRGRMDRARMKAKAESLLEMVKLPGLGAKYPSELSGGMQQRVAIARSLINDPSVILMDEPFAALDAITREHMNDELLRIWGQTRATVFFITHDIAEAAYMSDRILVMSARPGRIVADIRLDFPRPRGAGTRELPEYSHLLNEIRGLINH
jgi:NitT/TauT family transport system ATP-binding protein